MLTFPYCLVPVRVTEVTPSDFNVSVFKPDAGIESRVLLQQRGVEKAIALTFEALRPSDAARLNQFWDDCSGTYRAFEIPDAHHLWHCIEPVAELLSLKGRRWKFGDRPSLRPLHPLAKARWNAEVKLIEAIIPQRTGGSSGGD